MTKVSIGSQLKKARQKKEVTLHEIYQQTKIHPNILAALEEDTYDSVLNPIYMRSFLKRYAAYLGLDDKEIISDYNELHKQIQPKEKDAANKTLEKKIITEALKKEEVKLKERPSKLQQRPKIRIRMPSFDTEKIIKRAKIVVIAVGIIIALLILVKSSAFIAKKISIGFTDLAKKAEEARKTKEAQKTKIAEESKKAAEAQKAKEAEKPKSSPKVLPKRAVEPLLYTPVTTTKEQEKPQVASTPKAASVPAVKGKQISVPDKESLNLTIRVTNDVWVQLKIDGNIIFQNVLKKDSIETWKAQNTFEIWTGRAEAMYLNLNGIDLGVLGSGVQKGVVVTREGIKR